jgi:hypothetical protein
MRLRYLLLIAATLVGCGGMSEDDAEGRVREYAKTEWGAELGRCDLVSASPKRWGTLVLRCEIQRVSRREAFNFRESFTAQTLEHRKDPRRVSRRLGCFAVHVGVEQIGYGYPPQTDERAPCGEVSGRA